MKCLLVMAGLVPAVAAAVPVQDTPAAFDLDSRRLEQSLAAEAAPEENEPAAQVRHMSSAELARQPELLERALDSAVAARNLEAVRLLLPLYRAQPEHDVLLVRYAQAELAFSDGLYGEAAVQYRAMIAARPDLTPVRLRLAEALAADAQTEAARDQLDKVAADAALPPEAEQRAGVLRGELDRLYRRRTDFGLRYLHENNVNQAPDVREIPYGGGTLRLSEPEKARGFAYRASLEKDYAAGGRWSWRVRAGMFGKFYWDNRRYRDDNLSAGAGVQWRSGRGEWQLMPFYEYRRFGGQSYSRGYGAAMAGSYRPAPRWQIFAAARAGRRVHDTRRYLDGSRLSASATVLYRVSPRQSWFAGADRQHENARDASEAYRRTGWRIGTLQEWRGGLSVWAQAAYARREYRAPDIFAVRRADSEYEMKVSAWHRSLHLYGLTPRLTAVWNRNRSNHFFYRRENRQLFIELNKTF
ncbi:surface lipoprotein assembly modifier [Neisseria leonii]|uniref:Surface lipoprotein assembly modifier n=1 Tax=Neisseria leonii TaxID=2995413 RepID=A0A9X4IAM3_9NEIS|nr:surface lipoprotein assembly modifier [Neisseria sp. 51.81]MDD9327519.1 surface lipoprotein assembly modifier [Neisseria sp. 51.81]